MLTKYLASVLIGTALVSAPALAQTNQPSSSAASSSGQMNSGNWQTQEQPGQWRASKLRGLNVYNNNNEKIGDINELLVDSSGKVQAVVVGVGGFLGMGEHDVAVPLDQIQFVNEPRPNTTAANTGTTGMAGASPGAGTAGSPAATGTMAAQTNPNAAANSNMATNNAPATTGTVTTANRAAADNANRSYPDHAMLNMTKDQLKAAPEFKYAPRASDPEVELHFWGNPMLRPW